MTPTTDPHLPAALAAPTTPELSTKKLTPIEFAGGDTGYLSTTEAARYMPLNAQTIQRMCAAGQIEHLRVQTGKRLRYLIHRDVVKAWLRRSTVKAA